MFSIALRILQDREEAEDILQEAFLKVFEQINTFREDATFGAWLKKIVINKSINQLKKRKLEFEEIKTDDIQDDESLSYPTLSIDVIQNGVKQLPNGFRLVLSLYLFEGYSHKEIAKELDISESTSKTQYKRAKLKLKELLNHKTMAYEVE